MNRIPSGQQDPGERHSSHDPSIRMEFSRVHGTKAAHPLLELDHGLIEVLPAHVRPQHFGEANSL